MKNNVPKLRFPEFSGDWSIKTIEELCQTFKSGLGITSKKIQQNGLFPVYGGNGLRGYTDTFTHSGYYVLIGRQGALCGNINRSYGKSYISEHAIAVKANDEADTEFLAQQLDYINLNKLSESSAQPGLSVNKLLKLKLVVPNQKEQAKIADFLTGVDEKIQQLTQKKELLEQYKKGVTQQIFSQQIRFKDDNGNDYPDWEDKYLKDIAEINPKSENLPNNFYYVDLESVNNGRVGTLNYINSNDAPSRAQRVLSQNDILFQMVRPYQRNNLLFSVTSEDNYVASTGYAQLRARENYDFKFIFQLLLTDNFVNTVMLRCTGTSYPAINSSDLSTITINIPKYEEQVKIANFSTSLDDKITQVSAKLEKTKLFKKSLLQQLFI